MSAPDAYDFLGDLVNADEIRNLLRKYKKDRPKEVLVGGTKPDIVEHLRKAVDAGFIPFAEVANLIQESEENGDQHVFYFLPKNATVERTCSDGEEVAKLIWGANWRKVTGFPKFDLIPSAYEWGDFRVGVAGKAQDWIAKVYGHEEHKRFIKQEVLADDTIALYYRREWTRSICLARWNDPSVLELRVSRCDSKATLLLRLNSLWTRLRDAMEEHDFIPWDLRKARYKILKERAKNAAVYQIGPVEIMDSTSGRNTFCPHTDDEAVDDAPERGNAIDGFLRARARCDNLIVTWLPGASAGALTSELRTVIGSRHGHEVVIPERTSSKAVDYVTNQLRSFGS